MCVNWPTISGIFDLLVAVHALIYAAMNPIEIHYTLTLAEFMRACSAHWRATRQGTAFQFAAGLIGVAVGAIALEFDFVRWLSIALIVVGVAIWSVAILRWIVYRRAFFEAKKYTENIHAVFSHDGIHIDSAEGTSDLKWTFYSKYRETREFVLLYMTRHQFSVIPKSALADENEVKRFVDLVDSRIERAR